MNFAAIHKLPIVFCCENNRFAISVPQEKQMAVLNVADRAAGYGMPGIVVDGNDPTQVYLVACQAVERARRGEGPSFVEIKTYRFMPHTSNDDDKRYRTPEEMAAERTNDPIARFRDSIIGEKIWDDARDETLKRELQKEIDEAQAFAEASPDPTPQDTFTNVYAMEGER